MKNPAILEHPNLKQYNRLPPASVVAMLNAEVVPIVFVIGYLKYATKIGMINAPPAGPINPLARPHANAIE